MEEPERGGETATLMETGIAAAVFRGSLRFFLHGPPERDP